MNNSNWFVYFNEYNNSSLCSEEAVCVFLVREYILIL